MKLINKVTFFVLMICLVSSWSLIAMEDPKITNNNKSINVCKSVKSLKELAAKALLCQSIDVKQLENNNQLPQELIEDINQIINEDTREIYRLEVLRAQEIGNISCMLSYLMAEDYTQKVFNCSNKEQFNQIVKNIQLSESMPYLNGYRELPNSNYISIPPHHRSIDKFNSFCNGIRAKFMLMLKTEEQIDLLLKNNKNIDLSKVLEIANKSKDTRILSLFRAYINQ